MKTHNEQAENETLKPLGEFICVVDNNFVYHGDVTANDDFYLISHAENIRRWGTTQGLGELRNGKTSATITDQCGEILIPKARLCHFIRAQWKR